MSQYTAKKLEGAIDDLIHIIHKTSELLPDFNNCKTKLLELVENGEDKEFIENCPLFNPSLIALIRRLEEIRKENETKLREEFENWIKSSKDRENLFDLWLSVDED